MMRKTNTEGRTPYPMHNLLRTTMLLIAAMLAALPLLQANGSSPSEKKFILMRLEDIGPGGQYEGVDQLGKLRAVLEYLQASDVRFQLAVIPRWIDFGADGTRYDRSLDQSDDPYIRAYAAMLRQAVQAGSLAGMHGYTHQIGDSRRKDGHHQSGQGNEFKLRDVPETLTAAYAKQRVEAGLLVLKKAGIKPAFWEAPHYESTSTQNEVFRSYFGLHFQADMDVNPDAGDVQYRTGRNRGNGSSTLGAVYVPTPLSYIPAGKDEAFILKQLGRSSNQVEAFFYHPFLEFAHLLPVQGPDGKPMLRDGVPVYRYPDKPVSTLQKLIPAVKERGYTFATLHDLIPFVPGHSFRVGKQARLAFGDVNGDGQTDVVSWNEDRRAFLVQTGQLRGVRNESQGSGAVWSEGMLGQHDGFALLDDDGDGRDDLWVMRAGGSLEQYRSDGASFTLLRSHPVRTFGWSALYAVQLAPGKWLLAGPARDGTQLEAVLIEQAGAALKPVTPYRWPRSEPPVLMVNDIDGDGVRNLSIPLKRAGSFIQLTLREGDSLRLEASRFDAHIPVDGAFEQLTGDVNGDGRDDILIWDRAHHKIQVFVRQAQQEGSAFHRTGSFGPWGKPDARLVVRDFDGNGKADLALIGLTDPFVDLAYSYP